MAASEQPRNMLELLRAGDSRAFEEIYRLHYRAAADFVKANSGQEQDARDVFQDALMVLVKKSRDEHFRLSGEPVAYLMGVVHKIWLYRLRTRHAHPETPLSDAYPMPPETDDWAFFLQESPDNERQQAVQDLLKTINPECQKLFEHAYWQRLPAAQIAQAMGYTEAFVKVKKHRCMAALREKIKNHPAFKA
jgi:RNA polymerase sigma factor (sigma-70 family)